MTAFNQTDCTKIDGFTIEHPYEEFGEIRYKVSEKTVTCIKREEDWPNIVKFGSTYQVIRYAPKEGIICILFSKNYIGWYPITHFEYEGKPEHLNIPYVKEVKLHQDYIPTLNLVIEKLYSSKDNEHVISVLEGLIKDIES